MKIHHTFSALVKSRYTHYAKLLEDIISSIQRRFEPWPRWLLCCEEAFNFSNGLVLSERTSSLVTLMSLPSGPNPLLEDEKARLSAEFVTLFLNADHTASEYEEKHGKKITPKDTWYTLLTQESC